MKKIILTILLSLLYTGCMLYFTYCSIGAVAEKKFTSLFLAFLVSIAFYLLIRWYHREVTTKKFVLHLAVHTTLGLLLIGWNIFAVVLYMLGTLFEHAFYSNSLYFAIGVDMLYLGCVICYYQWKNSKV